jgi:protein gp37
MDPAWVRPIRDRCAAAGIPFFFKQWGGVRKKKGDHVLDGRRYEEFPS